jgi:hypothetical protein
MHEWQSLSHVRWGRLLSERETRGNHTWGRDDSIVAGYSRANRLSIQWSTVWVWLVHYTYLGLEFKYGVPRIPGPAEVAAKDSTLFFIFSEDRRPGVGGAGSAAGPRQTTNFLIAVLPLVL